jgi:cytidylate kinase
VDLDALLLQLAWVLVERRRPATSSSWAPGDPRSSVPESPNVLVCGYTAAGKTTHAQLIAQHLGYDYVSASSVLADRVDTSRDASWRQLSGVLREDRSPGIDLALDGQLARWARERQRVVFDAWVLPALDIKAGDVTIWLDSSIEARAKKCRVSQLIGSDALPLRRCRQMVQEIDAEADGRFLALYGVEYSGIRDRADVMLDNSEYIQRASIASAIVGIREFDSVLMAALKQRVA